MPDLNSVPASPRNLALSPHPASSPPSRRSSNMMAAPSLPLGSPDGNIPLTHTHSTMTASSVSHQATSTSASQNGNTVVPVRHPRPLTAAELHLELEKEQEAVVNRLTRELSILRAQNSASVASTTSSTSTTNIFDAPLSADHPMPISAQTSNSSTTNQPYAMPSLRHRSSSSFSTRSANLTSPAPLGGASQASVDRARDATGLSHSRQNSIVVPLRSGAPSPSLSQPGSVPDHAYFGPSHRLSIGSQSGQQARSPSRTRAGSTRFEEVAQARTALDAARSENDALAQRVKELEILVRARREMVSRPSRGSESSVGGGALDAEAWR